MSERRQTPEVIALIVLFLGITVFTIAGFLFMNWMPPVASQHGAGVDSVIRYLLLSTGAVLVIGAVALVGFLWRYGRGRPTGSPAAGPRTERWSSLPPVIGMVLIAEVGVVAKGFPVWEQIYGRPPEDAVVIEVTGQQFEWIVRYPGRDGRFGRASPTLVDNTANPAGLDGEDPAALDDIVVRNALRLPAGRPVYLQLRGRDVLHSFSVPAFRVKQDVIPGILGRTLFVPTIPGRYEIACTQICGMGHYRMRGRIVVQPADEYREWLQQQTGWLQR